MMNSEVYRNILFQQASRTSAQEKLYFWWVAWLMRARFRASMKHGGMTPGWDTAHPYSFSLQENQLRFCPCFGHSISVWSLTLRRRDDFCPSAFFIHYPEVCVLKQALGGKRCCFGCSPVQTLAFAILSLFNSKACFGRRDACEPWERKLLVLWTLNLLTLHLSKNGGNMKCLQHITTRSWAPSPVPHTT